MSEPARLRDLVTKDVPLLGSIDRAVLTTRSGVIELAVCGWIAHAELHPSVVEMRIESSPPILATRISRPDINELFSDVTGENIFGFDVRIPIPAVVADPNQFIVRCVIADRDGNQARCAFPIVPLRERPIRSDAQLAEDSDPSGLFRRRSTTRAELLRELEITVTFPRSSAPKLSIIVLGTEHSYPYLAGLAGELAHDTETFFVYQPDAAADFSFLNLVHGIQPIPVPKPTVWGQTLNRAMNMSRGEFVLLLSGEAEILPGSCERGTEFLRGHPTCGAVGGLSAGAGGEVLSAGGVIFPQGDFAFYGNGLGADAPEVHCDRETDFVSSSLAMVRRAAWEDVGGYETLYDGRRFVEADFHLRMWRAGWSTWFSPRIAMLAAKLESIPAIEEGPRDRAIFHRAHQREELRTAVRSRVNRTWRNSGSTVEVLILADERLLPADRERIVAVANGVSGLGGDVRVLIYGGECSQWIALERELVGTVERVLVKKRGHLKAALASRITDSSLVWCFGLHLVRLVETVLAAGGGPRAANVRILIDEELVPISAGESLGAGIDVECASGELVSRHDIVVSPKTGRVRQMREVFSRIERIDGIVVRNRNEERVWRAYGSGKVVRLDQTDGPLPGGSTFLTALAQILFSEARAPGVELSRPDEYGFGDIGRLKPPATPKAPAWDEVGASLSTAPAVRRNAARESPRADNRRYTDIIIPVHNAMEDLGPCLVSIDRHTDRPFRIVLIDDASTDPEIWPWLASLEARLSNPYLRGVTVLRNRENCGFPESVNRGIAVSSGHVVLLNSDTVVPPGWLGRLLAPIEEDATIASVTPFSNNATICSFPTLNASYDLPPESPVNRVDALVHRYGSTVPIEIPTGVGFCLLLNRVVLDLIGWFDAGLFGRGYGEENDWCARAAGLGFRNVLAPNLFVQHIGGKSFKTVAVDAGTNRLAENLQMLELLHPGYHSKIAEAIEADAISPVRRTIVERTTAESAAVAGVLYVHPEKIEGGSSLYLDWLCESRASTERQYRLSGDTNQLLLRDLGSLTPWRQPSDAWEIAAAELTPELFRELLRRLGISRIVVNHLIGLPLAGLTRAIMESGVPYSVVAHDYYMACPSYKLLRGDGTYCGGETRASVCDRCLRSGLKIQNLIGESVDHGFIVRWRTLFGDFLESAARVIAPSVSAAHLLERYFPRVSVEAVPHHFTRGGRRTFRAGDAMSDPLTIAVLGALDAGKGEAIVRQLVQKIRHRSLPYRVVVVGYTDSVRSATQSGDGRLSVTGPYDPDDVGGALAAVQPALVLIPSIWPETFSFTTQEALDHGYPVVAFDLGGPAEQIRARRGGWIVEERSVEGLLRLFDQLAKHREEIVTCAAGIVPREPDPVRSVMGDQPTPLAALEARG